MVLRGAQVAALPHTHNSQLVCLPALHVWSTVLGHESPASAAAFTAAGGGSGGLSRASTAAGDPEPPTAVALAAAALAAAEAAGGGVGGAAAAREPAGGVPSCVVAACHRLLLQTASNCMLWAQSAEGREAANSTEAAAAVHDLFLAICCVLGQVQYLQGIVLVAGGQLQQQQQQSGVPWWQQDASLQQAVQHIAGTPDQLRLQVAVEMAAAAVVQPLCDAADAAGNAGNGCCLDHQVRPQHDTAQHTHSMTSVVYTPAHALLRPQHHPRSHSACRVADMPRAILPPAAGV